MGSSTKILCVLCALCGFSSLACRRKHVPVEPPADLGYPACHVDGGEDRGTVVAQGHIRSGPYSQEKNVVERFEMRRTACGYELTSRQEWPLDISDVEVHFDADLRPIWAWKRMTLAGSKREDGNADIRRYELRTPDVLIKKRDPHGETTFEKLLAGGRMAVPAGARVDAVVGPGRGLVTAWLWRAKLPVGGKVHQLVLDFRAMVETVEMAALERQEDTFESTLGRKVRVYTFFGRDTVFADDNDVVIGDLAGMRPSDSLTTPEPPPLPTYGGADPEHTP